MVDLAKPKNVRNATYGAGNVEMLTDKATVLEEILEYHNECVAIKISQTANPRTSMGFRALSN